MATCEEVMQRTSIHPVIHRRREYYRCDSCGDTWSEASTRGSFRFWWACPRGCNWDAIEGFGDVMRRAMQAFLPPANRRPRLGDQERRRGRSPIDSDRLTLEEWSKYVDRLVAEVQSHYQDELREER
jgi:hypothetical protein